MSVPQISVIIPARNEEENIGKLLSSLEKQNYPLHLFEVIVVDDVVKLKPYKGKLDYMISTIPAQFDVAAYSSVLKRGGFFTQVGMPVGFNLTLSNIGLANTHVNFNA